MIACSFKPRWANLALSQLLCVFLLIVSSAAQAELTIDVAESGVITVAGSCGANVVFGSAESSGGVITIPLSSWSSGDTTNDMGNGTGGDDGTDDMGNGTGGLNDMGNGTGDSLNINWGEAHVSLRCNEADLIVYEYDLFGNLVETEAVVVATNYCQ
ncbi:MAG: hypothetical protein Tsb002_36070 [Wenzhouxiangellaceae bacterium]